MEHKFFYFQLFWKVYIVISNIRKIQIVLNTLWTISQGAFHILETQNYLNFLTVKIHIVNHVEHFFHISSTEPTDVRGLPQILPQSAKFLPRACSRRSRNIPSLHEIVQAISIAVALVDTLYPPVFVIK